MLLVPDISNLQIFWNCLASATIFTFVINPKLRRDSQNATREKNVVDQNDTKSTSYKITGKAHLIVYRKFKFEV